MKPGNVRKAPVVCLALSWVLWPRERWRIGGLREQIDCGPGMVKRETVWVWGDRGAMDVRGL